MVRFMLSSLTVLGLCMVLLAADKADTKDKTTKKESKEAKIVKVDAKKGTITLRMKDKEGKEVEKTFKLAEDIRYIDSTGRVAAIDVFTSGDMVLVVDREGKITEMKKKEKEGTIKKESKKPEPRK